MQQEAQLVAQKSYSTHDIKVDLTIKD